MVTEELFPNVIDSLISQHSRGSKVKASQVLETVGEKKKRKKLKRGLWIWVQSIMVGLFQDTLASV